MKSEDREYLSGWSEGARYVAALKRRDNRLWRSTPQSEIEWTLSMLSWGKSRHTLGYVHALRAALGGVIHYNATR